MITDCHIHIQPVEMFKPHALELMKKKRANFEQVAEFCHSPKAFLKHLDNSGIDRAVLINYVAPDQLLFPNDYLIGVKELEIIYRAAEANGIPVMFHTGTSIFPGARNKYGDPIHVDDVAIDFPKLKILLAHGGRPLWMDTAFFLVRRHPNVYLDISGIPPKNLLKYFPRVEQIADKTLFGTDWPGPGVPEIKQNLEDFRALPLAESAKQQILSRSALEIWPD